MRSRRLNITLEQTAREIVCGFAGGGKRFGMAISAWGGTARGVR